MPDEMPVAITAFEHLIGSPSCRDFSFGFMFSDQQIGGSPDVTIGDHSGCPLGSIIRTQNTTPGELQAATIGSPLGITSLCYLLLVPRLKDPTPFPSTGPMAGR